MAHGAGQAGLLVGHPVGVALILTHTHTHREDRRAATGSGCAAGGGGQRRGAAERDGCEVRVVEGTGGPCGRHDDLKAG